jgi:hypothetical protein
MSASASSTGDGTTWGTVKVAIAYVPFLQNLFSPAELRWHLYSGDLWNDLLLVSIKTVGETDWLFNVTPYIYLQ